MDEFECDMCGWRCHTRTILSYYTAKNGNLMVNSSIGGTLVEVNIKSSDCQFVNVGDNIFPRYHLSYKERTEPLDRCPRCARLYFAGQLIYLPELSIGDRLCEGLTRVGIDQFYDKTETFAISEGNLYVEFKLPKEYKFMLVKYQNHQGQYKYNLRLKESYGPLHWIPTDQIHGYIYTNFTNRVEWYPHFNSVTERYKEPIKMIVTYIRTSGKHTKPALRKPFDSYD